VKGEQAGACKGPKETLRTLHGDPHWELRRILEAWNALASWHDTPSWLLVVDESMLKWMGKYTPSRMFLRIKPDSLQRELKTSCDGLTGVCFRMEPMENIGLMNGKDFFTEFGTITAINPRLMEPFLGIGVYASVTAYLDQRSCVVQYWNVSCTLC